MITAINYETIQDALDDRLGCGGWFFRNDNGTATWFPHTVTQSEALRAIRGSGYLATWSEMEAAVNGPIGGPRGR